MRADEGLWIVIPKWDDFQHRDMARSSVPPWVKNYTKLLSDEAYLSLTGHQRAVLHGLWLEYARARRQLRLDTRSLSSRLQLRVNVATLTSISDAGFLAFSASKPASSDASQPASLEVEVEREENYQDQEPLSNPTATVTNNHETVSAAEIDYGDNQFGHMLARKASSFKAAGA